MTDTTDSTVTPPPADTPPPVALRPAPRPGGGGWRRLWSAGQFVVALGATVAFLAYLLLTPATPPGPPPDDKPAAAAVAEVVGPRLIRVTPGSPLDQKVQAATARRETLTDPLLIVSGRVAASLRPGNGKGTDFWQFDAPEVLTAFTDWQKAQADIQFAETQLAAVKQLAAARLDTQQKVVARLTKLVDAGTDTAKDLAAERANLIQAEIQGRKDTHEAETAVRVARRSEAALGRQLQLAGLDPDLLKAVTSDVDLVLADVPEARQGQVKVGQGCQATFFGLPNRRFAGKVLRIAPALSKERRSLRVLFTIDDLQDELRPGMFAEIGLGTDPREALLVPADGVLHVGRADYVLVGTEANTWRVAEVQVGEPHNGDVELLDGLKPGDRLIGKGAILFKPLVVRALLPSPAPVTPAGAGR